MPTGREIMERAAILLNDEDYTRWTLPELAKWINGGVRAIVLAKPSANAHSRILELAEGSLQTIDPEPAGLPRRVQLIGINRNLKTTDESPRQGGRIIRPATRQILDAQQPNWHDSSVVTAKKEVRNFVFDEQNPLEWYCYPPNDGSGIVEAVIGELPEPLTASGDEDDIDSYAGDVGLPDIYEGPLIDFVVFRAQSKDDAAGNGGRAMSSYQLFANAVGIKIKVEGASSPNSRRPT